MTANRKSAGIPAASSVSASIPPADAPIATTPSAGVASRPIAQPSLVCSRRQPEGPTHRPQRVTSTLAPPGIGAKGLRPHLRVSFVVRNGCGRGYYQNSDGQCIPDPSGGDGGATAPGGGSGGAPAGATAVCRDGAYSFSTHHTGTCSGHGGVARWLTN
ncbi:MAG: DUF3761 domain-containing protein [Mycobacterium sp.]